MELVLAPIVELRSHITHLFEEVVGATLDRGTSAEDEAYRFSCGLTGGSTALIFLGALREADVAWSRITLYWGDERAVPSDHPDSNFALAERLLISPLAARAPHAVPMRGDLPDLHEAARCYDALLPEALDLLILGVGDDGHVCSLFPGHRGLTVQDERVMAIEDAPKPPPRRLTITLPYLLLTRNVWIVAVGPRKLPMLQAAIDRRRDGRDRRAPTPLEIVMSRAKSLTLFTDQVVQAATTRRNKGSIHR